ncbi:hypothetical protein EUGRSUZ_D02331 [Eucalyptus grandis]|uniref:Cytochrome b5 heme-binding domain-containing protein n=1 Tax=Eucalyptus grandis TaxID=71139 RepID=A0A059CI42_EUCGR|nr:hypothetical protein EUGRSUZ_D02331 [Eucalyptus grandis]
MEAEKKYITAEELRKHSTPGDLWISIRGKVYDVTEWAERHPGGEIPLRTLAGQDVTDAFLAYHPVSAWQHLEGLYTGYRVRDFAPSEVSKDYRRLHAELARLGMFEKKGHIAVCALTAIALMLSLCVYGVVACEGVAVHFLCAVLLGLLWIQGAYMGHDSGHYQVMTTTGCNQITQLLAGNCLTGISIAWWKWTHNAHHLACNSLDHDPDLQHIPFCLNHFSANVYMGPPNGSDWFEKQTGGTIDISCPTWMDWFHGGLQFQLEHHLFPRLPRCQLRGISPLARDLCKKHNLPYRSLSFWDANISTLRTLRTAALQARDLSSPVPKNLVWEAVNTHG